MPTGPQFATERKRAVDKLQTKTKRDLERGDIRVKEVFEGRKTQFMAEVKPNGMTPAPTKRSQKNTKQSGRMKQRGQTRQQTKPDDLQRSAVYVDDDPRVKRVVDGDPQLKTGAVVSRGNEIQGVRSKESFREFQKRKRKTDAQRETFEERIAGETVRINPPGQLPKVVPVLSSGLSTEAMERRTGIDAPFTDYEPPDDLLD